MKYNYLIGALVGAGLGYIIGDLIVNKINSDEEIITVDQLSIEDKEEPTPSEIRRAKKKKKEGLTTVNFKRQPNEDVDLQRLAAKYRGTLPEEPEDHGNSGAPDDFDPIEWIKNGSSDDDVNDPDEVSESDFLVLDHDAYAAALSTLPEDAATRTVLWYYAEDDIVCTPDFQIVQDPEDILGNDALDSFDTDVRHPDEVFVYNGEKGVYYHLIRKDASYVETVTGGTSKPERPRRREDAGDD